MHDSFLNVRDRMLDRSRKTVKRNGLRTLCRFYGLICGCRDAVTLKCRNNNHFASKLTREFFDVDLVSVFLYDIHHVDGYNNGDPEFRKLCRQVKVSFKVCSVNDVEDRIGTLPDKVISCYNFFKSVR